MSSDDNRECKVDRVAEKWVLDDVDEKLREQRQNAEASLRDLEDYFNRRVLEAAMRDARAEMIEGEVENTYHLLAADDVSSGSKVEVKDRLRRSGVDPEAVADDFVSYQTIRTHLQECLEVDTSLNTGVKKSEAKNTVFKLLSRTEVITERTIDRLRKGYSRVRRSRLRSRRRFGPRRHSSERRTSRRCKRPTSSRRCSSSRCRCPFPFRCPLP